jgi:cation:H+ antiporter
MPATIVFLAAAGVSLAVSWLLVSRLERIGERLGLSEALLGMVAALAADTPEISAAVSAMITHQQRVGTGVVLGSNVFNLAALLGLSAVVAGQIGLHRKVVVLGGAVALWVAVLCVLVVTGLLPVLAGLVLAVLILAVYVVLLGAGADGRLSRRLPAQLQAWLRSAVKEEELELENAIKPSRGRRLDVVTAVVALAIVVAASVTMERAASSLGQRYGVPQLVTGGLVLAAVTSLPNAVAAVYLAGRGRGAATLSTALNSNTINVVAGLLFPAAILGLGPVSGQAVLVTTWYAGLSLAVLALSYRHRGLGRPVGAVIIAAYLAFAASLVISGYTGPGGGALLAALAFLPALALAACLGPFTAVSRRAASGRESLFPGWSALRLWALSMLLAAGVATVDAAAGHRLVLIGLLVIGPCLALLTCRWMLTALTGAWACGLAVLLGVPDGIWATAAHLVFISAVAIVAAAATAAAALIGRARC